MTNLPNESLRAARTSLQIPVVFHPIYSQLSLPRNHRFPIQKYQALRDYIFEAHPQSFQQHLVGAPVESDVLGLIHDVNYIEQFINGTISEKEMKRIGFPWSEQFVLRTRYAVAGTIKTARLAAEYGVAINMTGGYHHAHPSFGSGFCVFNDLALAAQTLINEYKANRVLIFDCDVHQGDGTATCCESMPNIFSLSIHCHKNFPARKQHSDWDIAVDKSVADDLYLKAVRDSLETALVAFKPDFIIYDAGVDIHENDDLGLINVSTAGVYARDKFVFQLAKKHSIPIMAVIGGGYQRDIDALTQVHSQMPMAAMHTYVDTGANGEQN